METKKQKRREGILGKEVEFSLSGIPQKYDKKNKSYFIRDMFGNSYWISENLIHPWSFK